MFNKTFHSLAEVENSSVLGGLQHQQQHEQTEQDISNSSIPLQHSLVTSKQDILSIRGHLVTLI